MLGLNLILGIVVDTFGEMRNRRALKEADTRGSCFVCGLPSHVFDKLPSKFTGHVKNEHNMWDYMYYTKYLESLSPYDRNFHGAASLWAGRGKGPFAHHCHRQRRTCTTTLW